ESTRPQQDQINGAVPLIDNDVKPKDLQERGLEESSDEDHPTELELKVLNTKNRISVLNGQVEQIVDFQFYGYWWLFSVGGLLMVRMLIDPFMIRRPLLEPNLEFSGLTFLTVVLLVFLIVNVISAKVTQEDIRAAESGKNLATAKAETPSNSKGPGYSLLFLFPVIPTFVANDFVANDQEELKNTVEQSGAPSLTTVTKLVAIFGQLIIVVGIYLVGYLHFNNTRMGIGIVTLYLLLPYTAEMTGRIIHILPAAAMVWAVVCYRKPLWSGLFIGLAMGLAYYPLFLLPLWISFYWHKGLRPFLYGYLVMVGILAITLIFTSSSLGHFGQNLRAMFGLWTPLMEGLQGFWESGNLDPSFRTPVIAAFFCLSISFAVWPAQKNLGTLLSCSAALMVAVQFWNGFGGGILMAWYLPLALMTMFRSNLEDRTAISLSLEK
ncbi:MAG: hypothetical protein VX438_04025, partial [Planctomycetota bacterium]|nr:hypothetical protein [Planctomycetota bacterium]